AAVPTAGAGSVSVMRLTVDLFRSAGQHPWIGRQSRRTVWANPTPGGHVAQILWFEQYQPADAPELGGKNASLGTLLGARLPVAVRSSATCEDQPDASFAGEHDTYLWVRGGDSVVAYVLRCWASLFTDRGIAYRLERGYRQHGAAMSVGVQQMVRPRAAGVAFTLNPLNGDRSQIAIDASWGFGEA